MLNNQPSTPILIEDLGYLYPNEKSNQKKRYGIFICECGNKFKAQVHDIKNKHTKSCGCYILKKIIDRNMSHGMAYTRIYSIWKGMVKRTTNINNIHFINYGGRGITVCDRWLNSFENFRDDMFLSYRDDLTIDRIDNNKGYYKENCRWVDMKVQNRNKRVLSTNNTSGYKGVSIIKSSGRFVAYITISFKRIHLGYFDTALEAAKAYDKYVIENNLEHTKNEVCLL